MAVTVLTLLAIILLAWPAWTSTDIATPILVYYRFRSAATDEMTVRTSVFESQLEALNRQGYTAIPLCVLVDHRLGVGPPPPRHAVVLTVDDGHRSVYTDLLPVLRRHGVPVTLFVWNQGDTGIGQTLETLVAHLDYLSPMLYPSAGDARKGLANGESIYADRRGAGNRGGGQTAAERERRGAP